jgi:hypothetical protein
MRKEDDSSQIRNEKNTNHRSGNMFKTVKRLIKAAITSVILTTIIRKISNRTGKSKGIQVNVKNK